MQKIGEFLGVNTLLTTGGTIVRENIAALKRGKAQVIIGTIGRVNDLLRRGFLKLDQLKLLFVT